MPSSEVSSSATVALALSCLLTIDRKISSKTSNSKYLKYWGNYEKLVFTIDNTGTPPTPKKSQLTIEVAKPTIENRKNHENSILFEMFSGMKIDENRCKHSTFASPTISHAYEAQKSGLH